MSSIGRPAPSAAKADADHGSASSAMPITDPEKNAPTWKDRNGNVTEFRT
jgi:hypothetical protein